MDCPKCKSTHHIKAGIVGGRQRFCCKNCDFKYTVSMRGKSPEIKLIALRLYLEGLGFRSIGRMLKVSQVSVMNWIKKFGKEASETPELTSETPIVEMDELHSFVGRKKTIVGFGLRSTDSKKSSLILRSEAEAKKQEKSCIKRQNSRMKKQFT